MKRELDALLRAWNHEQDKEQRLLHGILAALATNVASRQRMIEEVASAVLAAAVPPAQESKPSADRGIVIELENAVNSMRASQRNSSNG